MATRRRYPSQLPGYKFPYEKEGEPVLTYLPRGYRQYLRDIAAAQNTTVSALIVEFVKSLVHQHLDEGSK